MGNVRKKEKNLISQRAEPTPGQGGWLLSVPYVMSPRDHLRNTLAHLLRALEFSSRFHIIEPPD